MCLVHKYLCKESRLLEQKYDTATKGDEIQSIVDSIQTGNPVKVKAIEVKVI